MDKTCSVNRLAAVAGGKRALARLLGVSAPTICKWVDKGGDLPSAYHERMRAVARRMVFDEDEVEACLRPVGRS